MTFNVSGDIRGSDGAYVEFRAVEVGAPFTYGVEGASSGQSYVKISAGEAVALFDVFPKVTAVPEDQIVLKAVLNIKVAV